MAKRSEKKADSKDTLKEPPPALGLSAILREHTDQHRASRAGLNLQGYDTETEPDFGMLRYVANALEDAAEYNTQEAWDKVRRAYAAIERSGDSQTTLQLHTVQLVTEFRKIWNNYKDDAAGKRRTCGVLIRMLGWDEPNFKKILPRDIDEQFSTTATDRDIAAVLSARCGAYGCSSLTDRDAKRRFGNLKEAARRKKRNR